MSFTNTPLGQQRRLDRNAFLNGTKKSQLRITKSTVDNDQPESQTSPPRRAASTHTIPVSYSYGAPELAGSGSGSPPKAPSSTGNRPSSPSRSVTTSHNDPSEEPNSSEPANIRYARLKQRNQALGPTASSSSTSSFRGVDLRDTSVNVANAFTQAAFSQIGGGMPRSKSTASWSSGTRLAPPASTGFARAPSVLREEEDESNIVGNDSGEVDINGDPISRADRAKSPLYDALGAAGTFLLNQAKRATSRQPEDSASTTNIQQQSLSSVDRTSDYEDAEALYQRSKAGLPAPSTDVSKSSNQTKKKPRKSKDNALYKPSSSESEDSEGLDSDEGRRKKKTKLVKGMSLPIIGPSKTFRAKKPRRQSVRPGNSILGEGDMRSVSNLVQVDEEPSILPPSRGRSESRSRSRSHTPRAQSVGGQTTDSFAEEQLLDDALGDDDSNAYTDPDVQQQSREIAAAQQAARSHAQSSYSYSTKRSNKGLGVGAALGTFVRSVVRALLTLKKMNYDLKVVLTIVVLLSAIYAGLFKSSPPPKSHPISQPHQPSRGIFGFLFSGRSSTSDRYEHVPIPKFDLPPGSLEELIERLGVLERAQRSTDTAIGDMSSRVGSIEGYTKDVNQRFGQVDARVGQVEGRVGGVEGRVVRTEERFAKVDDRIEQFDVRVGQVDSRVEQFGTRVAKVDGLVGQIDTRVGQVDSRVGQVDSRVGRMDAWVGQVDNRIDQLGTRVGHVEQTGAKVGKTEGKVSNVDAHVRELEARAREFDAKAKEIEAQAKRFEGRAKDIDARASKIDAKANEIDAKTNEIHSKTKELDAKSRENDARSRDFESKLREIEARFKDASGSWWPRNRAGGQQEPLAIGSEAMDQLVQRAVLATTKDTVARADFALYTGGGRVIPEYTSPTFSVSPTSSWRRMLGIGTVQGRSPAVALVPDINVGNCWPFAGSQGQIAVLLSRSVKVDAVTIDHASKEVAYDLSAAPRKFAVWGLVEGADNLEKLAKYQQEVEGQTIGTGEGEQAEDGPSFKPARILLAEFEYDINASSHIQTFEVPERVRQAGIDVGVVVFQIRSSWGDPNYTCLYRVRVHGEAVGPNVSRA
ncbi:Myosin-4 [Ceratobasidium theobromae]|uniref:Myosin-4 n=1 Tax=Ceratobasidium theobromae TaxID=1582974 RepID=A0A5N5QR14_9AGAM|nr:Myosin-4 [Ceratobasidium theobromae]